MTKTSQVYGEPSQFSAAIFTGAPILLTVFVAARSAGLMALLL